MLLLVLFQVLILILLVVGWGYWTCRFLSGRSSVPFCWLFAGLAGYLAQLIVLDTATRLGVPIRVSTWPVLVLGILGAVNAARWLWHRWPTSAPRLRKDVVTTACVFTLVFALQSAGLLYHGPQNYYGKGRTDQLMSVILGQYLAENGFPYDNPELYRHPWTVGAGAMRPDRTIHVVANAELGVASLSDAKSAYGTQSVFFAALVPVCVFAALRSFSVWRPLAVTGALWVGILPSLTKIHLDGFFPQVSVLFLYPLLLAVSRHRPDRDWRGLMLIAIYLAYLFGAYPDFYPLGLVFVALVFASPWPRKDAKGMILRFVVVVVVSLVLNALFLRRGVGLFLRHLQNAHDKPTALEVLTPTAGTLFGWFEMLFRRLPIPIGAGLSYRASILCILGVTLAGISAFFSRSVRVRYYLAAAVAAPVGYLSVIVSGRSFPKYPFWKVSDSFAWLLAVLVLMGVYRLALVFVEVKRARVMSLVAVCGLALLSFVGYVGEMQVVFRNEENLAALNTPVLREAYRYLDSHPDSVILIRDENPIVVGWLSYHGRKANVYVDRILLLEGGNLALGDYPFYAPPPDMSKTLIASSAGLESGKVGLASVHVRNPQGQDRKGSDVWYWMADRLDVVIWIPDGEGATRWILEFVAMPGPSNPIQSRRLALTLGEAQDVIIEIQGRETVRIPVKLSKGTHVARLRVLWPTEQTVRGGNDTRKLMVRISNVVVHHAPE